MNKRYRRRRRRRRKDRSRRRNPFLVEKIHHKTRNCKANRIVNMFSAWIHEMRGHEMEEKKNKERWINGNVKDYPFRWFLLTKPQTVWFLFTSFLRPSPPQSTVRIRAKARSIVPCHPINSATTTTTSGRADSRASPCCYGELIMKWATTSRTSCWLTDPSPRSECYKRGYNAMPPLFALSSLSPSDSVFMKTIPKQSQPN